MHERSLVRALLQQVAELAEAEESATVSEVRVRVGPLSGVEPLLLAGAFDELAPPEIGAAARLVIQEVELEGRCQRCGHAFVIPGFRFICPLCGSSRVQVAGGEGVVLESVTLEDWSAGAMPR